MSTVIDHLQATVGRTSPHCWFYQCAGSCRRCKLLPPLLRRCNLAVNRAGGAGLAQRVPPPVAISASLFARPSY
ncbi:hypothetical protein KCP73_14560 [Salmonella enterica subsp. enterica]|nr:hypothetical protein KCP73_14560 [Salmonella enterica subsp. enterica]